MKIVCATIAREYNSAKSMDDVTPHVCASNLTFSSCSDLLVLGNYDTLQLRQHNYFLAF